jgi:hypothetical protein
MQSGTGLEQDVSFLGRAAQLHELMVELIIRCAGLSLRASCMLWSSVCMLPYARCSKNPSCYSLFDSQWSCALIYAPCTLLRHQVTIKRISVTFMCTQSMPHVWSCLQFPHGQLLLEADVIGCLNPRA